GRIDWLSDLNSFDTVKLFWSRVQLRHIDHTTVQNPHVNAGQSGCFLPSGPDGEPGVFLLFGGISPVSGACVEDLCIISPDLGRWFTVKPITYGVAWPAGRCGHSVCALDSNRALVMFGNLESFMAPSFDMAAPKPYRGRPAGDMWILTRCKSSESSQDWFSSQWFWTEIQCPINVPGCPPIDFYHEAIIGLPYVDTDKTESTMQNCYDAPIDIVYTVLCVSQSTDQLLEEAVKQRRNWQRRKPVIFGRNGSSPLPSTSALSNSLERTGAHLPQSGSDFEELGEMPVEMSLPSASFASKSSIIPNNDHSVDILPNIHRPSAIFKSGWRRTAEKRTRRLEALAVQERRLFGSRTNASVTSEASMHLDSHSVTGNLAKPLKAERIIPSHPMAVYSLRIRLSPEQNPQSTGQWSPATGQWLTASKPNYLDLLFGPPKCLGFSCTFAYGCVFLFGGDTEELPNDADNAVPAALDLPEDALQHANAFRPLNDSGDPVDRAGSGHLRPLTFVAKANRITIFSFFRASASISCWNSCLVPTSFLLLSQPSARYHVFPSFTLSVFQKTHRSYLLYHRYLTNLATFENPRSARTNIRHFVPSAAYVYPSASIFKVLSITQGYIYMHSSFQHSEWFSRVRFSFAFVLATLFSLLLLYIIVIVHSVLILLRIFCEPF
ncbi:hypothetical protein AHF37_03011, partial [Paragonimus kellicotti]